MNTTLKSQKVPTADQLPTKPVNIRPNIVVTPGQKAKIDALKTFKLIFESVDLEKAGIVPTFISVQEAKKQVDDFYDLFFDEIKTESNAETFNSVQFLNDWLRSISSSVSELQNACNLFYTLKKLSEDVYVSFFIDFITGKISPTKQVLFAYLRERAEAVFSRDWRVKILKEADIRKFTNEALSFDSDLKNTIDELFTDVLKIASEMSGFEALMHVTNFDFGFRKEPLFQRIKDAENSKRQAGKMDAKAAKKANKKQFVVRRFSIENEELMTTNGLIKTEALLYQIINDKKQVSKTQKFQSGKSPAKPPSKQPDSKNRQEELQVKGFNSQQKKNVVRTVLTPLQRNFNIDEEYNIKYKNAKVLQGDLSSKYATVGSKYFKSLSKKEAQKSPGQNNSRDDSQDFKRRPVNGDNQFEEIDNANAISNKPETINYDVTEISNHQNLKHDYSNTFNDKIREMDADIANISVPGFPADIRINSAVDNAGGQSFVTQGADKLRNGSLITQKLEYSREDSIVINDPKLHSNPIADLEELKADQLLSHNSPLPTKRSTLKTSEKTILTQEVTKQEDTDQADGNFVPVKQSTEQALREEIYERNLDLNISEAKNYQTPRLTPTNREDPLLSKKDNSFLLGSVSEQEKKSSTRPDSLNDLPKPSVNKERARFGSTEDFPLRNLLSVNVPADKRGQDFPTSDRHNQSQKSVNVKGPSVSGNSPRNLEAQNDRQETDFQPNNYSFFNPEPDRSSLATSEQMARINQQIIAQSESKPEDAFQPEESKGTYTFSDSTIPANQM